MLLDIVDLGVPVRKASPSRFPLQLRALITGLAGFPLQSLTRGSRSLITFLQVAVVLFSGCIGNSGSSTEVNDSPVDEASEPDVNSCADLPTSFSSYTEALVQIRSASFRIEEAKKTDESSWIRGAEFYSCDGISGFFILRTDDREYIHVDVPLSVWKGFKEASSFGTYYTANIKRRYRLGLN
jgi:hypothetical protein